jgi:hypothetical protein
MRPFQGRGTSLALLGGVAPGYSLVPLQGTEKLPQPLVSDLTDSGLRLYMLRMTDGKLFPQPVKHRPPRRLTRNRVAWSEIRVSKLKSFGAR